MGIAKAHFRSSNAAAAAQCVAEAEREFEPFIAKAVVAQRIEVEVRSVTELMRRGVIRYYKLGWMVRFKWSEVEEDLRRHFHVCCGGTLMSEDENGF